MLDSRYYFNGFSIQLFPSYCIPEITLQLRIQFARRSSNHWPNLFLLSRHIAHRVSDASILGFRRARANGEEQN